MVDAPEANKAFEEHLGVLRDVAGRLHELSVLLSRVGFRDVSEELGGYAGDVAIARKGISEAWGSYLHHGVNEDMKEMKAIAGALLGIKDEA